MLKTHAKSIIFLILLFLTCGGGDLIQAQTVGQGFPFLDIDADHRAAALGGTRLAEAYSASAAFANPAVIAGLPGLHLSTGLTNWIADIRHFTGAITYQKPGMGTIGITGVWMDYGTFDQRIPVYESSTNSFIDGGYVEGNAFTVAEYAVGLTYARTLASNLQVGTHFKYAGQALPAAVTSHSGAPEGQTLRSRTRLVMDLGTVYYPGFHDFRIGFAMKNLSSSNITSMQVFDELSAISIGGAMDLLSVLGDRAGPNQLTAAFDWNQSTAIRTSQHFGLEYGFMQQFFLRAGYRFQDTSERLTAGFGLNLNLNNSHILLDYAYSSFGDIFGNVHRVSIGFGL